MSVQEQVPYVEYVGNGVTKAFPVTFDCDDQDHLIVTVNGAELPVGQWILLNELVEFNAAPNSGALVEIKRDTPLERTTTYKTYNNSFRPEPVNHDFDRIWWKLQELGLADWLLGLKLDKEIRDRIAADIHYYTLTKKETDQKLNDLKDYIDTLVNNITGEAFLPILDRYIKTWSGRSQEEKNKDRIDVRDFIKKGEEDHTKSIQDAIDYAATMAQEGCRYTVVIDIPVFLSKQRTHATNWGSCLIVPSNVDVIGTGIIYTSHNYENRSVIFLCRGSNIDIQYLSFENTRSSGNYDIPVGGGTTYDDGLIPGTTYKNINCYNLQTYKNWIGISFQMRKSDGGTIIFEDINYLFCRAIAREGNTSSGNFNFRSDPPHKIKNSSMSMCHAENGATASSFNYVGVKGGNVIGCTSKYNLYAGCELENGTEGVTVNNLTSIDDYASLWIDDSSKITVNTIIVENSKDSIVSPLLGTRGKVRPAVWITYQGFESHPNYVTDKIFINNITGDNARILVERFGESIPDYSPSVGSVHIDGVVLENDITISITPVVVTSSKKFTLLNSTITSNTNIDCVRIGGTGIAIIENLEMTDVSINSGGLNIVSADTELTMRDCNISKLSVANSTRNHYSNNRVNGTKIYDLSNQIRTYPAVQGSPEGVLSAPLGSEVTRLDNIGKYIKTTSTGNTGWKKLLF